MNISTALSGIGSFLGDVTRGAVAALPSFAPLIAQAVAPRPKYSAYGYGGNGMAYTASSPYGLMNPGYMPGPGQSSIVPASLFGSLPNPFSDQPTLEEAPFRTTRYPKLLQRQDGARVITYVRAPAVRYHVSIRSARRRCVGGR